MVSEGGTASDAPGRVSDRARTTSVLEGPRTGLAGLWSQTVGQTDGRVIATK